MKVKFLWIGATKDADLARLEKRYLQRIGRFFPAELGSIPEGKKRDPRQAAAQFEQEAKRIDKRVAAGSYLVGLDEGGRQLSSRQLANLIQRLVNQGIGEVNFLAGGFLGIPARILERADLRLSLSRMTLPHELARVVLLEQIYRAGTLINRMPYHK